MPEKRKQHNLAFSAGRKMTEDIDYLVRELNHESKSNGSMLKTNRSVILRRIVAVGLKNELSRLRSRKIAELNHLVGNKPEESVVLQNRDIQIVPETVSQARYKQAQEAYQNGGSD